MSWKPLTEQTQLEELATSERPFLVFKHSTRCPVSSMAKRSVTHDFDLLPTDMPLYYLDLIQFRALSNFIAEKWQVRHESPQLLLLQGDFCFYHASHQDIALQDALSVISG